MTTPAEALSAFGQPHADTRIAGWDPVPSAKLDALGAEPQMAEEERAITEALHRFAAREMRPLGQRLDRMTPEEVIARDSPIWDFYTRFRELGFTADFMSGMDAAQRARMLCVFNEELAWGDVGLAFFVSGATVPRYMARMFGNRFLVEQCPETKIGCWGITEPDHGSDALDPNGEIAHAKGDYGRPNCVAKLGAETIVINGQKSAWVSNGTIADTCLLFCAADTGAGPDKEHGCVVIVPLDTKGVSRGKPLDKLGQRSLNQGEIFFDNVELPAEYLVAGPEHFQRAVYAIHVEANASVASALTGVARAAYDLAYEYVHERRQGGVPIIRHQSVASRLFHMYRKIEASRALARRVTLYNMTATQPALHAAMAAKVTATQTAFEVASDALQLFGGNGMTREYPIEKIFRDARSGLIEDGCNEVLAIKGGYGLLDPALL